MSRSARRILLVGGSSEIGLPIVRRLVDAADDAVVTLAGSQSPHLKAAEAAFSEDGHETSVLAYEADWGTAAISMLLAEASRRMGGLDLVVVAVGSPGERSDHLGTDPPAPGEPGLQRLLRDNFTGPALVANTAVNLLAAQRHGTLVVVSSGAAGGSRQPMVGYRSAERGLDELVRGLAARARPYGVQCVIVSPGRVRSARRALPRAALRRLGTVAGGTASHTPARP
ncbi:SDR family NAD(P)-dependent oxidoreductase [Pedococcus sp. P5_B7]